MPHTLIQTTHVHAITTTSYFQINPANLVLQELLTAIVHARVLQMPSTLIQIIHAHATPPMSFKLAVTVWDVLLMRPSMVGLVLVQQMLITATQIILVPASQASFYNLMACA